MAEEEHPQPDSKPGEERSLEAALRVIESRELFGGRHEVLIHHECQLYRLRITRNGKLILQK
jgi:hemin uptake protein HemP